MTRRRRSDRLVGRARPRPRGGAPRVARARARRLRRGRRDRARALPARPRDLERKPDRTFVTAGRHGDRARDPGADPGRVPGSRARRRGVRRPRRRRSRPAGTSTRSTAPTTSSAACRCSGRCSAVERDGELQVGVISAPGDARALVRVARRRRLGRGAGRRGGRIRVSRVAAIDDAQLVYGSRRENVASGLVPGFEALLDAVVARPRASATSGATRWSPRAPPRR